MEYTSSQRQAINHKEGPCLVLAVPGAGKTTVLLERLNQLLESGIPAKSIASITFSRQQAKDMEERFRRQYSDGKDLTFSTIHAFCYRILRQAYARSGKQVTLLEGNRAFSKFRIMDQLAKNILHRSLTEDEQEQFFRIDGYLKNALVSYREYKERYRDSFPRFEELAKAYGQFKEERKLIDFDDMLLLTLNLLDENEKLLERLQNRFRYLQVDEAQDTSLVQLRIIQKIAIPENNLFFVADDDQSIYGFRGANPEYLLSFSKLYPSATILTMEENHRSGKNIVDLSSIVIRKNQNRYQKRPTAQSENREKIRIYMTASLKSQLKLVTEEIQKSDRQTAILFRNNISALPFLHIFEQEKIVFDNRTQGKSIYRSPIIRDILDLLIFSRDCTDTALFSRIYYKLNSFLKKSFIQQLQMLNPYEDVFARLAKLDGAQNPFYREKIAHLQREFALIRKSTISEGIERIETHLGYGEYLEEWSRRRKSGAFTAQRILEVLKFIAKGYVHPFQLENRLQELALLEKTTQKGVVLSTVHGAKGLEFDRVWVVDLMENEFPGIREQDNPLFLEEERRLFYVALTRAKTDLRLVGRRSVNGRATPVSSFLQEVMKKPKKRAD